MGGLKKGQVTAKRAYEMADSLASSASSAKAAGNLFMNAAKNVAKREKKTGMKEVTTIYPGGATSLSMPDAIKNSKTFNGSDDWKKHGQMFLNRATHNSEKATRYRANADKAMAAANAKLKAQAGRDKPLPSSDGILSTIKNWFE